MQILIVAAVLAAAITATTFRPVAVAPARSESVLVKAVLDGGTIEVQQYGRVRLLGIQAPRIGRGGAASAPFADAARDRLASLILRRFIRLETDDATLAVRHGAFVMTEDGQCANTILLREGLARLSARPPRARLAELQRAEAEARTSQRGIWGAPPRIPSTLSTGYTRKKTPPT